SKFHFWEVGWIFFGIEFKPGGDFAPLGVLLLFVFVMALLQRCAPVGGHLVVCVSALVAVSAGLVLDCDEHHLRILQLILFWQIARLDCQKPASPCLLISTRETVWSLRRNFDPQKKPLKVLVLSEADRTVPNGARE